MLIIYIFPKTDLCQSRSHAAEQFMPAEQFWTEASVTCIWSKPYFAHRVRPAAEFFSKVCLGVCSVQAPLLNIKSHLINTNRKETDKKSILYVRFLDLNRLTCVQVLS